MLKIGTTRKDLIASFGLRDEFTVPAGTPVVFGSKDCEGRPFDKWTLPEHVARELSGNAHDSAHRFVVIGAEYVKADVPEILI